MNEQDSFLEPMVVVKPKKQPAKKAPKKSVIKAPKKVDNSKLKLYEGDEFENDSIIRKAVKVIVTKKKRFSIQILLDKFNSHDYDIVLVWWTDKSNKKWVFQRIYNRGVYCDDPDYIKFKDDFKNIVIKPVLVGDK